MKNLLGWGIVIAIALALVPGVYAQALLSDEFTGTDLASFWQVRNGDLSPWSLKDGWLVIEAGYNQNVWADDTATRFYQITDQDFDVETSMIVNYLDASTVAGIIAYSATTQDHKARDGQWVTLKLWGRGAAQDNNAVLQYQRREDDGAPGYVGTQPDYNPPQGIIPLEMRIKRTGNEYESWFKPEAQGDWVPVGKVTNELQDPLEVGIYAGIADGPGAGMMTVSYDYFKEASSPVTAVDPKHRLTVTWSALKSE